MCHGNACSAILSFDPVQSFPSRPSPPLSLREPRSHRRSPEAARMRRQWGATSRIPTSAPELFPNAMNAPTSAALSDLASRQDQSRARASALFPPVEGVENGAKANLRGFQEKRLFRHDRASRRISRWAFLRKSQREDGWRMRYVKCWIGVARSKGPLARNVRSHTRNAEGSERRSTQFLAHTPRIGPRGADQGLFDATRRSREMALRGLTLQLAFTLPLTSSPPRQDASPTACQAR